MMCGKTRTAGRSQVQALTEFNNFLKPNAPRLERRESSHVFIPRRHYSWRMLFLSAFARLIPREPEPNDLLAQHAALGHLGLTVIALVFVLITFWKS